MGKKDDEKIMFENSLEYKGYVINNITCNSSQVYDSLNTYLKSFVLFYACKKCLKSNLDKDLKELKNDNDNKTKKLILKYLGEETEAYIRLTDCAEKIRKYRNQGQHNEDPRYYKTKIVKYDVHLVKNTIQTYNWFINSYLDEYTELLIDYNLFGEKDENIKQGKTNDFELEVAQIETKKNKRKRNKLEKIEGSLESSMDENNKESYHDKSISTKSETNSHMAMFSFDKISSQNKTTQVYFKAGNNVILKNDEITQSNSCIIQTDTFELGKGFYVMNLDCNRTSKSKYVANRIYAIIFNIMQRSRTIWKDEIVLKFEYANSICLNYKYVYRYEMALLLMIKYDYKLNVYPVENYEEELKCAIYHINVMYGYIQKLMKNKSNVKDNIIIDYDGIGISFEGKGNINVEDITDKTVVGNIKCNADDNEFNRNVLYDRERTLWCAANVIYQIDDSKEDEEILKTLLKILFGYDSFKDGQLDVLKNVLNSRSNKMILMPTGSGKSLIFYFAAMLQPGPILVVEPTKILIKDQIRNLKDNHNIDDAIAYYDIYDDEIEINHKFIYITPTVMKSKQAVLHFLEGNKKMIFSNVILDEIHTLSNWSHDFRPAYLRMSFNLKTFLDSFNFLGFTATADNKVIKDISMQLNIDYDNILVPIDIVNENVTYEFERINDEKDGIEYFKNIAKNLIEENEEKMLVFTKANKINQRLKDGFPEAYKYEIDVFSEDDENSYKGFLAGRKSVLITNSEMGIGINIPEVDKILHFGIPTSMVNYIQEMGRAGRCNNKAYSYVTYIDRKHLSVEDLQLLDLNTQIDDLIRILKYSNSDLALAYKKILGDDMMSVEQSINKTLDLFDRFKNLDWKLTLFKLFNKSFDDENPEVRRFEKCLFCLSTIGIVHNWNSSNIKKETKKCDYDILLEDYITLSSVKEKTINYISQFGDDNRYIDRIEQSENYEDIIRNYYYWYYDVVIMTHRERLVNMYDFIENCVKNMASNYQISNVLALYFQESGEDVEKEVKNNMVEILSQETDKDFADETRLYKFIGVETDTNSTLQLDNLLKFTKTAINDARNGEQKQHIRFEKFLEMKYDILVDTYVLVFNLILNDNFNKDRFKRILDKIDLSDVLIFVESFYEYIKNDEDKYLIVNLLIEMFTIEEVVAKLYINAPKDLIYYYYFASIINKKMGEGNGN